MRSLILICLFGFNQLVLFGQNESNPEEKQLFYLEIGGPSTIASINYELEFLNKKHFSLFGRFGIGTTRLKDFQLKLNPDFTVPFGINFKWTPIESNSHFNIELMVGNTISSHVYADSKLSPKRTYTIHGFTGLGPSWTFSSGIFTRLTYNGIIENYSSYVHWGGLSLGYQL